MWSWGVAIITEGVDYDSVVVGHSLEDFIGVISDLSANVYFHNLRFDGHFIIDWLLKNGYEHREDFQGTPPIGQFTSLISDTGKFYSITIHWRTGFVSELKDSLKKLPMSVSKVAEAFELPESKGEIDYEKHRPIGYKMTPEEEDYLRRDVVIIARAMLEVLSEGMEKLTIGADALAEYKNLVSANNFAKHFPILTPAMDAEIRRAYRGGYTIRDKRRARMITRGGLVLDVNSLYPYIMYDRPLPYGYPEYQDGYVEAKADMPLTIQAITFTAKLRRNHLPCLQIKGSSMFTPTEYLEKVDTPTQIYVTNVDMQLLEEHYELNILEYGGGWRFHATRGMFDTYIDKWMEVKANSEGGKRAIAKLHLNSLYGKFATNTNVTGKVPYLDESGRVRYRVGEEQTRDPIYTAAGVFITSWARDLTIRAAQSNYDSFAYADTDSLHLLTDTLPRGLEVHKSKLGAWKHEYDFEAGMYLRAKAYLERKSDGTYVNRIAGLPERISEQLTFDDVKPGVVIQQGMRLSSGVLQQGKLVPKSVPGGIVLTPTPYRLDF